MSLPIKKIYVDTKYKSSGSVSNSNFKIALPVSHLPREHSLLYRRRLHSSLVVCYRRKRQ